MPDFAPALTFKCLPYIFALRVNIAVMGIEVIGQAEDGLAALEMARSLHPDVVVMDVSMPRLDGVEATRRIKSEFLGIKVIGLSMHAASDMAESMRDEGAVAYLSKGGPAENLVAAIRSCRIH
jgi:DNA-binding NarL/FixJ family response regulator